MKKEIDPKETSRAQAFELWMKAPNPMVGMNSGIFNNPFLIWGRYRKKCLRYKLPISIQFHHTQMDGAHVGKFLANLQEVINNLH